MISDTSLVNKSKQPKYLLFQQKKKLVQKHNLYNLFESWKYVQIVGIGIPKTWESRISQGKSPQTNSNQP